MEKSIKDYLNARYKLLIKMIEMTEDKINKAPEGRISIKHRNQRAYFYQVVENGDERFLKKEEKGIKEKLLQKNYLEKVLKSAKRELSALDKIQEIYPKILAEDVYGQLKDDRKKYVRPIVPTDEQLVTRWMEISFPVKPISNDIPFYQTMKGERVRSKSEMIIADRLYAKGIPYKYECPLKVGKKTIHPDFTILRLSDREVVYYEHCGRMDDPQYAEDMVNRVNDYSNAGIVVGDKLFMTFETSKTPMDVRVLDRMIDTNFR